MDTQKSSQNQVEDHQIAGWREWVALPELGVSRIKAKMDTGARTSCIHAIASERFERDGKPWLRFTVQPQQDSDDTQVCEAPIIDERTVRDSGGHEQLRPVVLTSLTMGKRTWPVEMTITNRERMKFRMLVGRTAMENQLLIRPEDSFLLSLED